jgi:hypothetical protein
VCDESALALHRLIDNVPSAVHIAVARGTGRPVISYPPMRVSVRTASNFDIEVEDFEVTPGETVAVYSAARSVVDAMRHRRTLGEPLARSALKRFLHSYVSGGADDVLRIAGELGTRPLITPAVESVLGWHPALSAAPHWQRRSPAKR